MSKRSIPGHHPASRARRALVLVAAALVVYAAARLGPAAVHFVEVWWPLFVAALAVPVAVYLALRICKIQRRPKMHTPPWLRHLPRALWAAARWHHLTRNLVLAYPDKHRQGKTRRPRAIVLPNAHGVVALVRTVPGCGRKEFDADAQHIADYFRCQRVSVSQSRPGRLRVAGLVRDPLLEHLEVIPPGKGLRDLYVGRDEHGRDRWADLANVPGVVVGGMPGAGKSTELTSWQVQLAPSPCVQFVNLDGKGAGEFADFEPRAWLTGGEDLDEGVGILEIVHGVMTDRLACVRRVLGTKNAWHAGPTEAWPLVMTTIDECQQFFDLAMVKGDRDREAKVRRCIFLASSLIRRGRSVAMLTVPATQKPTGDSVPTAIRDNCPLAMSFAVRTTDAAAATLGSAIREFSSYSPAGMALPEWTGVATVTLTSGQDPYCRIRGPWVTEDQAAAVALASAHLRKDPRAVLPVVVPDDARELAGAS